MAIPIFSWSRKPIRTVTITLFPLVETAILNFKMAANHKIAFTYISVVETHRGLISMAISMFSGSWNPLKAVIVNLKTWV